MSQQNGLIAAGGITHTSPPFDGDVWELYKSDDWTLDHPRPDGADDTAH